MAFVWNCRQRAWRLVLGGVVVALIATGGAAAIADADPRLEGLINLRTDRFPFDPPVTPEAWADRAKEVRRQVQVAGGLWPMPQRPAPHAVIGRPVKRDGYTIESVSLESYPGLVVTGSLYRPAGDATELRPGVLCPHGHWGGGRFHAWGDDELARQLASGAERFERGGRHPLQARCVQLARMGCVVFLYDMLGYGDSRQFSLEAIHGPRESTILKEANAWGFYSAQAELRIQGPLGVQTYNSLCALDWLESLPYVDPERLAVTGGSSGATQTLMLCAVDDRPAVAFPVVMVSTAMQGGCGCENACCLRIGTSNVEFAALMAPKPLGMASADDWTRHTAEDGYPELQRLYTMLGVPDHVTHASLIQFPHNYNYASRAAMYPWLDRWLGLDAGDRVVETDYKPVTPDEVRTTPSIADADVDRGHEIELMRVMAAQSEALLEGLTPHDATSLAEYRDVVGGAFEVLLCGAEQAMADAEVVGELADSDGATPLRIANRHAGVELPAIARLPVGATTVVVITSAAGKAAADPSSELAASLLARGVGVLGVDLFAQGDLAPDDGPLTQMPANPDPKPIASLTYGYNPTAVAHRAGDLLATLAVAKRLRPGIERVGLVADASSAPYAIAALALAGDAVDAAAVDIGGFRFTDVAEWRDSRFLPGAVKYGDVPGLLALGAPRPTVLVDGDADHALAAEAYEASGTPDHLGAAATLPAAVGKLLKSLGTP
ncbi:Abhydrolase family protein [Botrimarina colliarenosi]|uniref:Abhydrolase family protein n=1 Tax=Botrimarina colliarenosi TaxID=2528001 RepID=A0A5C6AHM7_9BACT|nr:acetylxylan esterase [Botrimarina colliarenosi]TWT97703.1 Abhydrolase family protein [Botrimarina colliarenosi]